MTYMPQHILTVLLLLLALPAQAATQVQVFSTTLKLGDNLPEGLDELTLDVDRFDPALGTLTGVSFSLRSSLSAGVVFYTLNDYVSFGYTPVNYVHAEFLGLSAPPDMAVDKTLATQTYTDGSAGGGAYWTPRASDLTTVLLDAPPLAQYQGVEPFSVLLTIEDRSTYYASYPLTYVNDKYVISDVVFTATYTYTPAVPEPGVWALLGIGLTLLGLWAGRRGKALLGPAC